MGQLPTPCHEGRTLNPWGMDRTDLQQLSKEQLIELVLRLQRPDKNSRTSSKPPSTDKKEERENSRPGGAKPGHEPHNRRLADNPDEFRDHMPSACEQCGGSFSLDADKELIGEYDEIEIPPVNPHVIRHRRFACRCRHCGVEVKAPAPAVATTTPFGPRISRRLRCNRPACAGDLSQGLSGAFL
jgi:transposase